jgi:hypothetical protein
VLCIIAAIVANGGKIGGYSLPGVGTVARQVMLGVFGLVLAGVATVWALRNEHRKVFRVGIPELSIEPTNYDGPPPCRVQNTVTFHTSGGKGGTITYRFENEEGDFSKFLQEDFKEPGSKAVNQPFVTKKRMLDTKGFVRIYSPQRRDSKHIRFRIRCHP